MDDNAKPRAPRALIGWHSIFMGVALLASARSKDQRTRNGACIVSTDHRIIGVGYNGLPRGCDDSDPVYWSDTDDDAYLSRHSYVVHAEINAILNCVVLPLTDATIYATQFPCPRCAQAIIQSKMRRVIYLRQKPHHERANMATLRMFESAGVELEQLDGVDAESFAWATDLSDYLRVTPGRNGEEDV